MSWFISKPTSAVFSDTGQYLSYGSKRWDTPGGGPIDDIDLSMTSNSQS